MGYMKVIVSSCGAPLLSTMSELDGQRRTNDLQNIFLQSTRAFSLLSGFMGLFLILDGQEIIRVWVGQSVVVDYRLVLVLSLAYIVALSQHPSSLVPLAAGRHRLMGWWSVVEGVANLLLSIYWARQYGLLGVALGTAVPMVALRISIQPWYALRILQLSGRRYIVEGLGRPLIACVLFVLISRPILHLVPVTNGFQLMVTAIWQGLLFLFLSLTVGSCRSDRDYVIGRVSAMKSHIVRISGRVILFRAA